MREIEDIMRKAQPRVVGGDRRIRVGAIEAAARRKRMKLRKERRKVRKEQDLRFWEAIFLRIQFEKW